MGVDLGVGIHLEALRDKAINPSVKYRSLAVIYSTWHPEYWKFTCWCLVWLVYKYSAELISDCDFQRWNPNFCWIWFVWWDTTMLRWVDLDWMLDAQQAALLIPFLSRTGWGGVGQGGRVRWIKNILGSRWRQFNKAKGKATCGSKGKQKLYYLLPISGWYQATSQEAGHQCA